MNIRNKTIQEWLDSAEEDLAAATALWALDHQRYLRVIPFHCQQAIEKSIKGYLAYKGVKFPRTHDLGFLVSLVADKDAEAAGDLSEVNFLTPFAVVGRYPQSPPLQIAPHEIASALAVARRTLKTVLALIK